jgi:hypothetical protein
MAKKYEDNWLDVVKRLQELSNISPEEERQQLLEAAKHEPKILDDKEITLADIAKLAGIREYTEPKVSKEAEALIESIVKEDPKIKAESSITQTIREADSKRLKTIADLEEKLAELKAEQKEEQTYESEAFREVLSKDIAEYIKTAEDKDLVELYNSISDNEAVYNEESSNILIKTEETREIIADAEELEQQDEVVQEEGDKDEEEEVLVKDPNEEGENIKKIKSSEWPEYEKKGFIQAEASGHEGQSEPRKHSVKGDASQVEKKLKDAGVQAEVEQDGENVEVHTMSDKDTVEKAVKEVDYTDDLSENNQQGK